MIAPASNLPRHSLIAHRAVKTGTSTDAVTVRVSHAGDPSNPMVLFLHGFPDLSDVWHAPMHALMDRYFTVAPDGRGVGGSTAPNDTTAYTAKHFASDIAAIVHHFGHKKAILVGHDWGGMIAWWTAILNPDLVDRLIIMNSPHPGALQDALNTDPKQRQASAYIDSLRAKGANDIDVAAMLEPHLAHPAFDEKARARYRAVFNDGKTLEAFLGWYRAAPFVVGSSPWHQRQSLQVQAATHLLWGMEDPVFPPALLARIKPYVPNLTVTKLSGVGHNSHLDTDKEMITAIAAPE